jgi:hypothetical protein
MIAQPLPSPASNCSTVFAKVNLPCIAYVSKIKLRLRSGMQSLLHKPLPLQSPQRASLNICTRAPARIKAARVRKQKTDRQVQQPKCAIPSCSVAIWLRFRRESSIST